MSYDPDPVLNAVAETPPPLLKAVKICKEGTTNVKRYSITSKLKQSFLSHNAKHLDTKHIHTDESKLGNEKKGLRGVELDIPLLLNSNLSETDMAWGRG